MAKKKTKSLKKKATTTPPPPPTTPTALTIQNVALASGAVLLFSMVFFWWVSRPTVWFNMHVHKIPSLTYAAETASYKKDGKNLVQVNPKIFVGTDPTKLNQHKRGLYAHSNVLQGETLVHLPSSSIIGYHDIFPSSWQQKLLDLRVKGYPKQKTILPQHQLAIGVMGSFLGKINGDKVGLTREYYRANVKQYNNNAEQQQTMYSYWKPFHKKFMNSIKHYTPLNVPPSPGTWRVFNSYYRTYFRGFSNPQAKSLYAMATSRAYKKDALLPVLDYASKSFTPNTNVTCTSTGCTLLALENIQAGNEITQPFETGSTIYLLQKHGAVHGITSSSASTQNSVAHGVGFAKCTIHFESLATFPDTGGINPTEWECLTTENQEKSAVLKWALRERNVYHENLKMANVALLHNKQDVVSVELLRWYQTELDIFTNEPNNELFENLIQNELKKEKSEVDRKFWAKEALNAFARL